MAITIGSNPVAGLVKNNLNNNTNKLASSFQKLSSGLRINKASDDPAGLSELSSLKVNRKILTQAVLNLNDGIGALNTAEGAVQQLDVLTTRLLELGQQSANGVLSTAQRRSLQTESDSLVNEFNRITGSTKFNGRQLLDLSSITLRIQSGTGLPAAIDTQTGARLASTYGTGTFGTATSYSQGTGERAVELVDLNGDSKLDQVTATDADGKLNVRLGNGDGTFGANTQFNAGVGFKSLNVTDVNNDGKPDVIGMSASGNTVYTFLGDGTGSFGAAQTMAISANTAGITVGDVNGDGKADIVTTTYSATASTANIYLGTGTGSYTSNGSFATDNYTTGSVSLVDMNNDGRLDIVAMTENPGTNMSVLLGNGNGTFQSKISTSLGGGYNDHSVGDFNRDGYQDVIVQSLTSTKILLGNGNGTFQTAQTINSIAGPTNGGAFKTLDINGDGYNDIEQLSSDNKLYISLGRGDGTFGTATGYTGNTDPRWVAIGDLNGDGVPDIVTASKTDSATKIFLANTQQSSSIGYLNIMNQSDARSAVSSLQAIQSRVSNELGNIGAYTARLESATRNVFAYSSTIGQAAGQIESIDYAQEVTESVRLQVIQNAATAVLAQANQSPSIALQLLRS